MVREGERERSERGWWWVGADEKEKEESRVSAQSTSHSTARTPEAAEDRFGRSGRCGRGLCRTSAYEARLKSSFEKLQSLLPGTLFPRPPERVAASGAQSTRLFQGAAQLHLEFTRCAAAMWGVALMYSRNEKSRWWEGRKGGRGAASRRARARESGESERERLGRGRAGGKEGGPSNRCSFFSICQMVY